MHEMGLIVRTICLGASFLVAGCVSSGEPKLKANYFVETSAVEGVSVALTLDGCTASVLFDDATVSGGGGPRVARGFEIPLKVVGVAGNKYGVFISGASSGYYSGVVRATAKLSIGAVPTYLFLSSDPARAQEGNWKTEFQHPGTKSGASMSLFLELTGDGDGIDLDGNRIWTTVPPQEANLTVDTIDLVMANCGA